MEVSLVQLRAGEKGEIKRIEGGPMFHNKMASLNIRPGKVIIKVAAQPFRGPITIDVNGRRITLGRGMAMRIFVEVGG